MVFTSLRTWGTTLEDRFPLCKWVIFFKVPAVDFKGVYLPTLFSHQKSTKCVDLLGFSAWKKVPRSIFSQMVCFFFMVMNPMVGMPPKNLSKKQTLVILHQLDACFFVKIPQTISHRFLHQI